VLGQSFGRSDVGVTIGDAEKYEADQVHVRRAGQFVRNYLDRDFSGVGNWIEVGAGRDRWERQRPNAMVVGDSKRFSISTGQSFGFASFPAAVDRAHGVNDVLRSQAAARR